MRRFARGPQCAAQCYSTVVQHRSTSTPLQQLQNCLGLKSDKKAATKIQSALRGTLARRRASGDRMGAYFFPNESCSSRRRVLFTQLMHRLDFAAARDGWVEEGAIMEAAAVRTSTAAVAPQAAAPAPSQTLARRGTSLSNAVFAVSDAPSAAPYLSI